MAIAGLNPLTGEFDSFPLGREAVDPVRRIGSYSLLRSTTRQYRNFLKANGQSISDVRLEKVDLFVRSGFSMGTKVLFALRKLNPAYSGSCVRLRRSSDNAEQDIGFVNSALDTTSLLAFVGSGDGFVVTLYDQSGNGSNATAINAEQGRIVVNGVLQTQNGKPTLRFSSGEYVKYNYGGTFNPPIVGDSVTAQAVFMMTSAGFYTRILSIAKPGESDFVTTNGSGLILQKENLATLIAIRQSVTFLAETPFSFGQFLVASTTYDGANATLRINNNTGNSSPSSGNFDASLYRVGLAAGNPSGEPFIGILSEFMIYDRTLTTDERGILSFAQQQYFGIS